MELSAPVGNGLTGPKDDFASEITDSTRVFNDCLSDQVSEICLSIL
jgi:hypothetical protein